MRQELKDRAGILLGYRQWTGNRINGYSRSGYLVGWYYPVDDRTHDRSGRLIGRGDLLASLIVSAQKH